MNKPAKNKKIFDKLYLQYNRREFISPDPLQFLYNYNSAKDKEIVGLIASSLAYGNVKQIIKSVGRVLAKLGPSPHKFLMENSGEQITMIFRTFKHRFTTGKDIALLLIGAKNTILKYGSLERCFMKGLNKGHTDVIPALSSFVNSLANAAGKKRLTLLPSPEKGSACKRLNLYLRWMIRRDDVDIGDWNDILPSRLIVPLDTHMFNIGRRLGFTNRKQADLKTAVEITNAFASVSPEDPVKYDFALTRLGIRSELSIDDLFSKL